MIFDFRSSFIEQLKQLNLRPDDIKIKFTYQDNTYDDYRVDVDLNSTYSSFDEESFLHSQGYRVGKHGVSKECRRKLLKRFIDSHVMSISEIKQVIQQDLKLFSNRQKYNKAIADWKSDMQYLNSLIDTTSTR